VQGEGRGGEAARGGGDARGRVRRGAVGLPGARAGRRAAGGGAPRHGVPRARRDQPRDDEDDDRAPRRGVQVRRGGRIETVDAGSLQRTVVLGGKPRPVTAISWGDVSTAYHSTGIGDITVSMAMPPGQVRGHEADAAARRRCCADRGDQAAAGDRRAHAHGAERGDPRDGHADLWAQATAADGRTVEGRLRTPEGYKTTVITALLCVRKILAERRRRGTRRRRRRSGRGSSAGCRGSSSRSGRCDGSSGGQQHEKDTAPNGSPGAA
jgi:hypothetical protein